MANSLLFEEPLLQDPDKEVIFDLASEFGASMIKSVLDLLRGLNPLPNGGRGTPLVTPQNRGIR